MMHGPIDDAVAKWHLHLCGELAGGLNSLLHDDVVLHSPIAFTPITGRAMTSRYLQSAGVVLNTKHGPDVEHRPESVDASGTARRRTSGVRYVKQVLDGHVAVLEFESMINGTYVNGVDILTVDDDGLIVEIRVMVRPLQAVNAVHATMSVQLDRLGSADNPR